MLRKMTLHRYFLVDDKNSADQEKYRIKITSLFLLGVLYCKGTSEEKASAFYRAVYLDQPNYVLKGDQRLKETYLLLLKIATVFVIELSMLEKDKIMSERQL